MRRLQSLYSWKFRTSGFNSNNSLCSGAVFFQSEKCGFSCPYRSVGIMGKTCACRERIPTLAIIKGV